MSASGNAELVETLMDCLERADREALDRMVDENAHPAVEWVPLIADAIEGGYHGREGIRRFLDDMLNTFEVRYAERETRELGDQVVLNLSRMDLRGRESGLEISKPVGTVYEFEGGLIRRGRVYEDQSAAVAAAEGVARERI